MNRTVGISLLGCGVVGGGVVKILREQRDLLRQRTGLDFDLRHVVVRDTSNPRRADLPLTTDAAAALNDPQTQIVVELIGGTAAAGDYVQQALRAGKHVVTANKSLLSRSGPDLFALARKHNVCIAFEASCGGGIPIINAIAQGLVGNRIDALIGIVNGTCNFILTQMTRHGWTYDAALKEAQSLGFAERDPTLDVSGRDAAQKLALLAGLAFNVRAGEQDIHVEGIDRLQDSDIKLASELGYIIKLLAIAERFGDEISLRVHPTLLHKDDVLADVGGSFNAISLYGHALGHALFYGRGAGQMPTASAVVADLVGVAMGVTPLAFQQLQIFPDSAAPARVLPFHQLQSRYYLRLMARDEPGVMAQAARVLGENKISLSAILQHEVNDGAFVPIVITTHRTTEGQVQSALKTINALPIVKEPTMCIRIIDLPQEFAGS